MAEAVNHSTPVVILQTAHHGGLGIARSLGRLGVPVYCVDAHWEPAFSSRYCRDHFVLNIESAAEGQSVDRLLQIGRKLSGRPILIPTTDRGAVWVGEHAAALQSEFRFQCQDGRLVRWLCDKSQMQELARRSGVATAQWPADQARFRRS